MDDSRYTVHGKILEGEKFWQINGPKVFGEEKFGESVGSLLKTLAFINIGEEKFGESVGSLLKILAFINIGGENFGESPTVRQIRQNFPPPKFSHVWYSILQVR